MRSGCGFGDMDNPEHARYCWCCSYCLRRERRAVSISQILNRLLRRLPITTRHATLAAISPTLALLLATLLWTLWEHRTALRHWLTDW